MSVTNNLISLNYCIKMFLILIIKYYLNIVSDMSASLIFGASKKQNHSLFGPFLESGVAPYTFWVKEGHKTRKRKGKSEYKKSVYILKSEIKVNSVSQEESIAINKCNYGMFITHLLNWNDNMYCFLKYHLRIFLNI